MQTLDALVTEYSRTHRNPVNQVIHWLCIPVIVFSTLGLLWSIPTAWATGWLPANIAPWVNFGSLLMVIAGIYYLRLSLLIFVEMMAFSAICLILFFWIEGNGWSLVLISAAIWITAWVAQFIGHYLEGAKPSFLQDIQFLLVGPAFLLDKAHHRKWIS